MHREGNKRELADESWPLMENKDIFTWEQPLKVEKKYVEKERKSKKERKAGMASLLIFLISYVKLLLFIEIMTQGDVWISDAALHLGCR